jgi:hypothetical protein
MGLKAGKEKRPERTAVKTDGNSKSVKDRKDPEKTEESNERVNTV